MTIKQEYYNIFLQLKELILNEIQSALNRMPKTIPCKVIANNGETVDVQPTINLEVTTNTIKKVPIAKSKYFNIPFSVGDIGLLVPASYIYDDLILSSLDFINAPKKSTTLSSYLFIPTTNINNTYDSAGNNSTLYSSSGESYVSINDGDIELSSDEIISFNKIKTFLDDFQSNYNSNISKINTNNATISGALSTLGQPVVLQSLTQYNGSYR